MMKYLQRNLRKNGASLVEPVDISLEELFVVLEESRQSLEKSEKTEIPVEEHELQNKEEKR